jgi:hypothetical protein
VNHNIAIAEQIAFLGGLDPQSQPAGSYATGPVDTSLFRRLLVALNAGVLGTSGTLTLTLQSSATSGGTYAAVAGLTACPVVATSGNKVLYEVRSEALQAAGAGRFVKAAVAVAGSTNSLFAVEVYGGSGRYLAASDNNAPAVQAVVLN